MDFFRKLIFMITLVLFPLGFRILAIDSFSPGLTSKHQFKEARYSNKFGMVVSSQCPNNYCVYLPIVLNSVPEIDTPSCRWSHNSGQNLYIYYKWGNRLQTPGSLWCNAFEDGLSDWHNAQTLIRFNYSIWSDNKINTYESETDGSRGRTVITCAGSETEKVEILGNIYWDIQDDYTVNQRRGIATHEVGHGQSIGHIPNEYWKTALMYKSTPLSFFSTTFTPQSPDITLVNQIYR